MGIKMTFSLKDLDNIQNRAELGAKNAIEKHAIQCQKNNDGRYVKAKECSTSMNICKTAVYKKIDKAVKGNPGPTGQPPPADGEQPAEEPEVTLSVKIGNHKGKILGGLVGVESLVLIGAGIKWLIENWPS